jgi:hypothetical protein
MTVTGTLVRNSMGPKVAVVIRPAMMTPYSPKAYVTGLVSADAVPTLLVLPLRAAVVLLVAMPPVAVHASVQLNATIRTSASSRIPMTLRTSASLPPTQVTAPNTVHG